MVLLAGLTKDAKAGDAIVLPFDLASTATAWVEIIKGLGGIT